jgi:CheY-like chemotaxis protein
MHERRRRPLVLVVEDDQSTRKLYAGILIAEGFQVAEAHNGLQAMEKAGDLLPEALVCDLGLPGIDGFEMCRRLQRDERTRGIPIIAITGRYCSAADIARARRDGCHAVLVKPIVARRLVVEVKSLLRTPPED